MKSGLLATRPALSVFVELRTFIGQVLNPVDVNRLKGRVYRCREPSAVKRLNLARM